MKNYRGIFILSNFRFMIDKVIYEEKYDAIDEFMSDSNIGAIMQMNIRNHLFVNIANINSVALGNEKKEEIYISQLESVDKLILRKILKTSISTPIEAMYLELGILRIGTMVKARRLNFLN